MADISFAPKGAAKYFEHPDSEGSIEFPTAPLAIGHEQIGSERVATKKTAMGTIRLLNQTDTIKDRLLWWYLDGDRQCWEQALDIGRNHKIIWPELKEWHRGEGYADRYKEFKEALNWTWGRIDCRAT